MNDTEKTPKRILMTVDTLGGVWTYALELIAALRDWGTEVILATMGRPLAPDQAKALAPIENARLCASNYRLEWMADPWSDIEFSGEWLLDLERQFAPDIIHLNNFAHGSLGWRTPKLVVGHSCVLSWWQAVHGTRPPAEWRRYGEAVRIGLQMADAVVAPSHAMLDSLQQNYGPLPPSRVIPNGRHRATNGALPKQEIVLTAGRIWDEAKNITLLNEICEQVPWPVYVAGESVSPDHKRQDCERLRKLGRLSQEELDTWLAKTAIYVAPAKYEPFGLTILEAALNHCALILSDIRSLRELWGEAAVFVGPADANGWRRELKRVIESPSRRAALAEAAFARASEFSPRRMAAAYVQVYEELLRGGSLMPQEGALTHSKEVPV